jgi:aminopeptidase N
MSVVYHYEGDFTIVSCGAFIREEMYNGKHTVFFQSDQPVLGLSFSLDKYEVTSLCLDGITLNIYTTCLDAAGQIIERAATTLNFYKNLFVLVPYRVLNFCYDPDFTICSTNSNLIYLYRTDEIAVSHELAHIWWGMCVTGNGPGWKWFHEAFADFFSELFLQKLNGEDPRIVFYAEGTTGFNPYDVKNNYFGMEDEEYECYKDYLKRMVINKGWEEFLMLLRHICDEYWFKSITIEHLIAKLEGAVC